MEPVMPDPTKVPSDTTDASVIFLLGQLSAKLDDVHQMCHKIDDNHRDAVSKLETRMESVNSEQDVRIDSLMQWRARVRGIFGFLLALPAVGFVLKHLGITIGGLL
jgi:hypothetical protein